MKRKVWAWLWSELYDSAIRTLISIIHVYQQYRRLWLCSQYITAGIYQEMKWLKEEMVHL